MGWRGTVYAFVGFPSFIAWARVDTEGMLRGVAVSMVLAAATVATIFTAGIASPWLYVAANFAIGFASGVAIAKINNASWQQALVAGLISGAMAAAAAGIRLGIRSLATPAAERPPLGEPYPDMYGSGGDAPDLSVRPCDKGFDLSKFLSTFSAGTGGAAGVASGVAAFGGPPIWATVGAGLGLVAGVSAILWLLIPPEEGCGCPAT